jgi:hypothetical protein
MPWNHEDASVVSTLDLESMDGDVSDPSFGIFDDAEAACNKWSYIALGAEGYWNFVQIYIISIEFLLLDWAVLNEPALYWSRLYPLCRFYNGSLRSGVKGSGYLLACLGNLSNDAPVGVAFNVCEEDSLVALP